MKNIYTTSLEVSKRIVEIIGEQESYFCYLPYQNNVTSEDEDIEQYYVLGHLIKPYPYKEKMFAAFTLSELHEVLKKSGEKLGWKTFDTSTNITRTPDYIIHYIKCCEIHATGGDVNQFLLEILK